MRGLLQGGDPADEAEEPWDQATVVRTHPASDITLLVEMLSLEDMLSCWARDERAFARVDCRLRAFFDPVIAEAGDLHAEELERLHDLRRLWDTLIGQLVGRP